MFEHTDILSELNNASPLSAKLNQIHLVIKQQFPFIRRVAVALYDEPTDTIKTYSHSSEGDDPLSLYEAKLHEVPSLQKMVQSGQPRVVQDLGVFKNNGKVHTRKIDVQGYRASYTLPMYDNSRFFGLIFFNSYEKDIFDESNLRLLDIFGHLIASILLNELNAIRTLVVSVQAARHMTHHRDVETGEHINRMAHYARIIAKELAQHHEMDDEYIEKIFLFSSLHDIGKIAVPDAILRKQGRLTEDEFAIMQSHATLGREIIDEFLTDLEISGVKHADILRNIAEFHHEAIDGTGYPAGLRGNEIPIEARICAVADVFDALTTKRPYKEAWSNEDALIAMQKLAGAKLDAECVEALIVNMSKVVEIQNQFFCTGS